MSDVTSAPDPLAESAPVSPVDSSEVSQADAPATISLDEARKLRSENANMRRRLHEREQQLQQYQDSGLSELDKAQRRIQELETAIQAAAAERKAHAVERLFKDAQYPDLLIARVPLDEIELDDAGAVRRGEALVREMQTRYPGLWQRSPGSGDGGAQGAAPAAGDMNQWIRRRIGR